MSFEFRDTLDRPGGPKAEPLCRLEGGPGQAKTLLFPWPPFAWPPLICARRKWPRVTGPEIGPRPILGPGQTRPEDSCPGPARSPGKDVAACITRVRKMCCPRTYERISHGLGSARYSGVAPDTLLVTFHVLPQLFIGGRGPPRTSLPRRRTPFSSSTAVEKLSSR